LSAKYVLTLAAEADLRGIARYTRKAWGAAQARRYAARLAHGIEAAVSGQGAFRDMSAIYPGLRMARCEHHFIFVLPRDGALALVVAILHERMDLMVRLQGRL
jgi:plasmid stabilization system protein ParE